MLSPHMLKSTSIIRRASLSPERKKSTDEKLKRRSTRSGSFMLAVQEDPNLFYEHEDDDEINLIQRSRFRTPSPGVQTSNGQVISRNSLKESERSPKESKLQRRKTSTAISLMRKLKIQKKSSPQSEKEGCRIEVHAYSNDPTIAWEMLKVKQPVKVVKPMALNTPMKDDCVRFVCLADTHGEHLDNIFIPDGDVLLVAGNFTRTGHPSEVKIFNQFLGTLPHKYKIVIAGNHELTFDSNWQPTNSVFGGLEKLLKGPVGDRASFIRGVLQTALAQERVNHPRELLTNCIYLEDQYVSIYGLKIYGSPWVPLFDDLAFNLPRGQKLLDKWNHIPSGIDALITHTPPLGYGDLCHDGHRLGCVELLNSIRKRIHPKYHVFGHVLESYGCTTDGYTKFINASIMNGTGIPHNAPLIFDIALPADEIKD